jgi:hypothetical protein
MMVAKMSKPDHEHLDGMMISQLKLSRHEPHRTGDLTVAQPKLSIANFCSVEVDLDDQVSLIFWLIFQGYLIRNSGRDTVTHKKYKIYGTHIWNPWCFQFYRGFLQPLKVNFQIGSLLNHNLFLPNVFQFITHQSSRSMFRLTMQILHVFTL